MSLARVLSIACIAALVTLGACNKEDEAPAATYTVRGQIKTMPGRDGKMYIHHEAIPDFTNRSGKQVGMMSMSMPFGVASNVSLDGLAAGEPIELTFSVRWNDDPPMHITAIRELPADTKLELSGM